MKVCSAADKINEINIGMQVVDFGLPRTGKINLIYKKSYFGNVLIDWYCSFVEMIHLGEMTFHEDINNKFLGINYEQKTDKDNERP